MAKMSEYTNIDVATELNDDQKKILQRQCSCHIIRKD